MSETGNGRKNWTRVVAAVGLVFRECKIFCVNLLD